MKLSKLLPAAFAAAMMIGQTPGHAADAQAGNAFDFNFQAINGKPMPLADFRGRVLLVVNTASYCGFTKQYEGLQALNAKYKDRGLTVIGVPSNDFYQEMKSEGDIEGFCKGMFGVTFPLTQKYSVTGAKAHPFYQWANGIAGSSGSPGWNFHKYLIGADGKLVSWFPTRVEPGSPKLIAAIEAELAKREKSGS